MSPAQRSSRRLKPVTALVALLFCLLALVSRTSFSVCLAGSCCPTTAGTDWLVAAATLADVTEASGCCGSRGDWNSPAEWQGEADRRMERQAAMAGTDSRLPMPANRGSCCPVCCVELTAPLAPATLPRAVAPPRLADTVGILHAPRPAQVQTRLAPQPHQHGPPRPERRTDQLTTTILRQ